jgi:hypothetical protein
MDGTAWNRVKLTKSRPEFLGVKMTAPLAERSRDCVICLKIAQLYTQGVCLLKG